MSNKRGKIYLCIPHEMGSYYYFRRNDVQEKITYFFMGPDDHNNLRRQLKQKQFINNYRKINYGNFNN